VWIVPLRDVQESGPRRAERSLALATGWNGLMNGLRLNLGCGMNRLDGYINVDRYGEPDVRHDLEDVPWPWPDDSVSEVLLKHVLEHLGRDPAVYLDIMKELYRVCHDGAAIRVIVPHHRHEFFYNDPTHVRAVTADGMTLFSQRLNRQWIAKGFSHSPLGIYLGVDFELTEVKLEPSELWHQLNAQRPAEARVLLERSALYNNVIQEVHMTLRPVKPAGREVGEM
jgi:hypothetical protein